MLRTWMTTALLVAGTLSGCAWNPARNCPELALVSKGTERALGAEGAKQVAATIGLGRDQQLTAYVDAIGQRLVAVAPGGGEYHFEIADMDAPNAFARISRSAPLRIATGLGAVAPGIGRLVGGIGTATTNLLMNPCGRSQEREADGIGQKLVAQAGWDPAALPSFLGTLQREEELSRGKVSTTGFLSSHPATPQRIAATTKRATTLTRSPRAPIARDRHDVLRRLEGLVVGDDPAAGLVAPGRFTHPDFDVVVAFPEDWKIRKVAAFAGALSPDRETQLTMQVGGAGTDPMEAERRSATETGIRYVERPVLRSVNGLRATPTALAARVKSAGPAPVIATANRLEPGAPLRGEVPIKVAREQRYHPGPGPVPAQEA